MKFLLTRLALISTAFILLVGCAAQKNVALSDNFWKNNNQKIAVTSTKAPKPQLYRIGGEGLIDMAVNDIMNNNLNKHLATTDLTWYRNMPTTFSTQLNQHHIDAKSYLEQLDAKQKSLTNFAAQVGSDKLLVIKLQALGATRRYYGFIPTGTPEAYCEMIGELIDTKNNQVLWRYKASIKQPIVGEWDQPPHYPNLSNAINVAAHTAQQELVDSFFSGH